MGQRSSTASINNSPASDAASSATNSTNHRHRHRNRNVSQSASNQSVANMSPRSRLRNEISRRGYSSNQDILFRILQAQSSQSPTSNRNQNSDLSSDEDESTWNHDLSSLANTLPFILGMRDLKCFVCNKMIPADDVEAHIMMCLTKPRLTYNEDVLADDKGECVICFEELEKGQTIARLPCLCIYHKHCIDQWLERSQSCPGHPPD
ncbi:E3 ubiquitin- ligase znrf1 [Brachionus plicatilis]|uniref:E3 ubiquitin-protein ligase ZNRF1 n=1 Tax=Brachionus plicatilis TaxID=10195 RepID=A0A3M7SLW0_BRAPC|nr:E3 ubiquitin- ligase znrf1 [Brachionus plicatilis]